MPKWIFQKTSTDQQGVRQSFCNNYLPNCSIDFKLKPTHLLSYFLSLLMLLLMFFVYKILKIWMTIYTYSPTYVHFGYWKKCIMKNSHYRDCNNGMENSRGQWILVDTFFQNGWILVDIFKGWIFVVIFNKFSWTFFVHENSSAWVNFRGHFMGEFTFFNVITFDGDNN